MFSFWSEKSKCEILNCWYDERFDSLRINLKLSGFATIHCSQIVFRVLLGKQNTCIRKKIQYNVLYCPNLYLYFSCLVLYCIFSIFASWHFFKIYTSWRKFKKYNRIKRVLQYMYWNYNTKTNTCIFCFVYCIVLYCIFWLAWEKSEKIQATNNTIQYICIVLYLYSCIVADRLLLRFRFGTATTIDQPTP